MERNYASLITHGKDLCKTCHQLLTHAQNFASARAEARLVPRAGGENEPGNESLCDYPDKETV